MELIPTITNIPTTSRESRASSSVASLAQLAFAALATEASDEDILRIMTRVGKDGAGQMMGALTVSDESRTAATDALFDRVLAVYAHLFVMDWNELINDPGRKAEGRPVCPSREGSQGGPWARDLNSKMGAKRVGAGAGAGRTRGSIGKDSAILGHRQGPGRLGQAKTSRIRTEF
jgi:hypothetical protein